MYLLQRDEFKDNYKILNFETPTSAQQKKFCEDYVSSKANKAILKASDAFKSNYSINGKSEDNIAKLGLEMALKHKNYIKLLRGDEKTKKILTWSQMNGIKLSRENVILNKKAKELIIDKHDSSEIEAHSEFHINWEYSNGGVEAPCKSLIDRLIIDHEQKTIKLIDIKTSADVNDFKKSFEEYEYGLQMAFYCAAIYWYLKYEKNVDPDEYSCEVFVVAIQNNTDYQCRVFKISESIILEKKNELERLIPEVNWHMTKNKWDYTREYYEGDGSESL